MKKIGKLLLAKLLTVFLLLPGGVWAEGYENNTMPLLWMVEGKQPTWLFGTIHLPNPVLARLPLAVEVAFRKSDAVYTEIPMDASALVGAAMLMQRTDGQTLLDVLPADLVQEVDAFMEARGNPLRVADVKMMKTWVLSTLLVAPIDEGQSQDASSIEDKGVGAGQALDMRLYLRAQQADKEVGGLETVVEQVGYFERFSEQEQILMLRDTLSAFEQKDYTREMLDSYLKGDAQHIMQLMADSTASTKNPELQQKFLDVLLDERNEIMAERIVEKLKQNPETEYFFAVGAGHLAGGKSVQHYLQQMGHTVRRVGFPNKESE